MQRDHRNRLDRNLQPGLRDVVVEEPLVSAALAGTKRRPRCSRRAFSSTAFRKFTAPGTWCTNSARASRSESTNGPTPTSGRPGGTSISPFPVYWPPRWSTTSTPGRDGFRLPFALAGALAIVIFLRALAPIFQGQPGRSRRFAIGFLLLCTVSVFAAAAPARGPLLLAAAVAAGRHRLGAFPARRIRHARLPALRGLAGRVVGAAVQRLLLGVLHPGAAAGNRSAVARTRDRTSRRGRCVAAPDRGCVGAAGGCRSGCDPAAGLFRDVLDRRRVSRATSDFLPVCT